MQKVLAVTYSQTGQTKELMDGVLQPFNSDPEVDLKVVRIEPKKGFPFPWDKGSFFQAFPESVEEVPVELEPIDISGFEDPDLVVLAYQPWYLSPSIPISSFLSTPEAQKAIKGKPVVTLTGARNMWLQAQERIRKRIDDLGGSLIGHIAMVDRAPNLVSLFSIIGWMMKGKREGYMGVFPRAGISKEDMKRAPELGKVIKAHFDNGFEGTLQNDLGKKGAVSIDPVLMLLEERGKRLFKKWARFVRKKGGPHDPARRGRVRLFSTTLFIGIFILSPVTLITTKLSMLLGRKKVKQKIAYYSGEDAYMQ